MAGFLCGFTREVYTLQFRRDFISVPANVKLAVRNGSSAQ